MVQFQVTITLRQCQVYGSAYAVPTSKIPTPVADADYEFEGWYYNDINIGKTAEDVARRFNTVLVTDDIVITAHFKQKEPEVEGDQYYAGFYVLKKGQSQSSTETASFFDVDKLYPSGQNGKYIYEYQKYQDTGILARAYTYNGSYKLYISNSIIKNPAEWDGEASTVKNHFVNSPTNEQIQQALTENGFDTGTSEVVWYRIVEADEGWHVDGYVRDKSSDKVNVTFYVDDKVVMNSVIQKTENWVMIRFLQILVSQIWNLMDGLLKIT